MEKKKVIAIFYSFMVSVLFVAHFFVAKDVLQNVPAIALGGVRGLLGGGLLLFIFRSNLKKDIFNFNTTRNLFFVAFLGFFINQILFLNGLKSTSPLNTSVIMNTIPLAAALMAMFFKIESFSLKKIIGVFLGFSLIMVLTFYGKENGISESGTGDLLIFASVLTLCGATVITKKIISGGFPPTLVSAAMLFLGGSMLLIIGIQDVSKVFEYTFSSGPNFMRIIYEVFFSTALTYLLSFQALKVLAPSQSMIFIYMQPPLSASIEYFLYDKTPSVVIWPVFIGICIAGWLVVSKQKGEA